MTDTVQPRPETKPVSALPRRPERHPMASQRFALFAFAQSFGALFKGVLLKAYFSDAVAV
jgi:hypothetical protein